MYICIYVYQQILYIYIYIYIYIYVYVFVYIYLCIHICLTHKCMYTNIFTLYTIMYIWHQNLSDSKDTYTHMYIFTYKYMCAYVYIYICMHKYILNKHTGIYIWMYIYILNTPKLWWRPQKQRCSRKYLRRSQPLLSSPTVGQLYNMYFM